jgi:hypothetical protein
MERLLIVAALTAVIHLVNTLAYSVRLSGVRTGRIATAFSLFNVIFLLATTANTLQAPLLASIVEQAINSGEAQAGGLTGASLVAHPAYQAQLILIDHQIRLVIAAAAVGTLAGAFLIPAFVQIFIRAIYIFEETGSVPRMVGTLILSPRRLKGMLRQMSLPRRRSLSELTARRLRIPKTFLVLNVLLTAIYTIGVLAAVYAGALFPEFRTPATYMSAVVNGFATVLAATVVDPTVAAITDQAVRGERSEEDVKQMTLYLAVTRLLGAVLAQAIFVPSAYLIKSVAALLA